MKKIMAVMLILCMALTILPMGISVGATETETSSTPTLIFDMTISGDATMGATVTDGSNSGKTGAITYGLNDQANNAPTYGATEQGTPYLNFKTAADSSVTNVGNRAVNVAITDTTVYDADEMTISAWVYSDNNTNAVKGYLFSFGESGNTTSWAYSIRHSNGVMMNTMFKSDGAGAPANEYNITDSNLTNTAYVWPTARQNAWKHVTITRKWTQTAAATESTKETGYYTVNLFVDGVAAGSYTQADGERQTYADAFGGENAVKLAIGNTAGLSGIAYGGKIADFKLYTGILTTDAMLADYNATYDDFYGEVTGGDDNGGDDPEEPGNPTDPEDPTEPEDPEDPENPSTTSTLVFDMDLAGSSASSVVVADSSNSGITGTITYGVSNNGRKPTFGVTEQGTKYLNFETAENVENLVGSTGSTYANTLAVNVPLTGTAGQAVYNADEITASAWVRSSNPTAAGYIFSFGEMSQAKNHWSHGLVQYNTTRLETMFGADGSGAPPTYALADVNKSTNYNIWPIEYSNAWKHLTVTRKWNQVTAATADAAETGNYTVNLYIDGVLTATYTSATAARTTYAGEYAHADSTAVNDVKLAIGNCAGASGNAYGGSIGDFKLWTGIKSAEEIAADYNATVGDWYDTDSTLVFDMDLSLCSSSTIVVADESGNNKVEKIIYGVNENGVKPAYGVTEQGTPYLAFDATDDTAANKATRAVNLSIRDKNVYDADAMTISAWVHSDNVTNNSYFFSFGEVGDKARWGYSLKNENTKMLKTMFDAGTSGAPSATYSITNSALANSEYVWTDDNLNKWEHITLTRVWTQTAAATETTEEQGYYTVNFYINGEWAGSCQETTGNRKAFATVFGDESGDTNNVKLAIGNCAGASGLGFDGKIADFKVYTEALSTDAIARDYQSTKSGYYDIVTAWKSVKFTNQEDQQITDTNGLLANATEVTADVEVSDYDGDAKVILGLYDTKGTLIAINMEDLGEPSLTAVSAASVTATGSDIRKATVYLWEDITNIAPVLSSVSVMAEPAPLKVTARFKDGDNNAVTYMDGNEGIKASLSLTAGAPSDKIVATLKLMRGTEVLYSNSSDAAVFTNGAASLEVAYEVNEAYPTLPTAQEGDELLVAVTDMGETVFEKRLPFADQSKIVDVILVAGQSNAVGQGGDASISFKPAADTVYYGTMGNNTLSTSGNTGWDSALAKTWHEETGRTVLVVKAAWGGTGFPKQVEIDTGEPYSGGSDVNGYWNPDNEGTTDAKPYDCYTKAKNQYEAAITSVNNAEGYTLGRQVYFWNQGCNENGSYTAAEYEAAFMELHGKFKEWGIEYGGILPVRSSLLNFTASTDAADTSLKLTGPRIAQYKMGEKQSDIFVVADVMERWSSNAAIEEWFAEKYAGEIFYDGQENMPASWRGLMSDHVHYNQYALNELGVEAARGMLAHLRGQGTADGIDVITPGGIKHIEKGGTITLPATDGDDKNCTTNGVIPVMPVASGLEGTFTLSGDTAAELTADGVLVPKTAIAGDFSTLTVTYTEGGVEKTMSFRVESALVDASVEIEIASAYNNYPAIYTLLTDDGYYYTNDWLNTELARIETAKGLEANSLKATMGLVPDWMGGATKTGVMTWEQAQTLASNGRWGVANHTKSHNQGEFTSLTAEELSEEINGGRAALLEKFPGHKIVGLLTPGGASSELIRKTAAEEHFALRRTGASYNLLPLTQKTVFKEGESESRSLYTLTAAQMRTATTESVANAYVDNAIANGGWVVGMWHGVGDDPNAWEPVSAAVATAHLEYVADKAKAGQLWVTTYDEASVYAKQRVNTRLSLKETTDTTIVFALEDDLGVNALYDATLTVNVTLPGGWTTASATIGGETIPSTVEGGVLTMNIKARNAGNITIAKGE